MESYFQELGVGDPEDRVEAKLKVTGGAKFAAEYEFPGLLYGVLATSTIANGSISNLDVKKAEGAPGVKYVMTHLTRPQVPAWDDKAPDKDERVPGNEYRPFFDNKIYFSGQPIALVVADTLERAQYGASVISATYNRSTPETDLNKNLGKGILPPQKKDAEYERGDQAAYQTAAVKVKATYHMEPQIHNQMEPHAAIAIWDGAEKLNFYNKAQWVQGTQEAMAKAFKLKKENVRVISKFVGGAFGGASRTWPHEWTSVMAAKKLNVPVKVVLNRDDLFTMTGHRPEAVQQMKLSADAAGKLLTLEHDAIGHTSVYEQFAERIVDSTKMLYDCDNVKTTYKLVPLNVGTPTYTRAPGEASGVFALETAMDELAVALNMDPIDLRMKNYASEDPEKKLPFSAKNLDECYRRGAENFGWNKRKSKPRSTEKDGWLIGMGMSSAVYGSRRMSATIKVIMNADGSLFVQSATADSGPGTYTIMTQIAADAAKYPIGKIIFQYGDSTYPPAPGQFGSFTAASVGTAVYETCTAMVSRLKEIAVAKAGGVFQNKKPEDIDAGDGYLWPSGNSGTKISYIELLKRAGLPMLELTKESKAAPEHTKFSIHSYGASFVEVMVNKYTGMLKISRVTSVVDNGKVLNKKTARNQVLGCVAWGVGMGLMEEGVIDHRYGRYVNANLADYHVSVNADVPRTEVIFIDKPDYILDPMGAKGLGEIPFVGFAAAVGNAVYNATGIRVRDLPITCDKILPGLS